MGSIANLRTQLTKRGGGIAKAWTAWTRCGIYHQCACAIYKPWGPLRKRKAVYKACELLRSIRRVWGDLIAKREDYF